MLKRRRSRLSLTVQPRIEALEQRLALTVQMVVDLNSDELGLDPQLLTTFRDEIYFTSNPGNVPKAELWKSDGTDTGTQLVAAMGEGEIIRLEAAGDQLIAVVQRDRDHNHRTNDLYASDGTQLRQATLGKVARSCE